MRTLRRVVWSEGMHLGPHHFQVQNRYFEDSVHFAISSMWYDSWGFIAYEIDPEALADGTVSLIHARGVFPDGLAFHMPECDALPPARNITQLFPPLRDLLEIRLAVPPHRDNALNCALPDSDNRPDVRYLAEPHSLADENTGRDEKLVHLGRKNILLMLDTEELADMVSLPLARVRRDGAGRFILDPHFVPPSLRISASERLMFILRRLIEMLEDKAATVARPKELGMPTMSGFSAQGIANAWFLHCVNSSLASLRHLCFSKGTHPEELYVELTRLAGALCTFGLELHPSAIPLYSHERPEECFEALDHHIRTHLELVVPSNCVQIGLSPAGKYVYEGEITDQRTLGRSRWIFAIRCPIGEAELIQKVPKLVKVCSRAFLPKLVSRALPGLTLMHLTVPPPAVSPRVEWQYFGIDKVGPCWEHMVQTRRLAVYVPGEFPEPEIELHVILES